MVSNRSVLASCTLGRIGDWLLVLTSMLILSMLAFRYLAPTPVTAAREFAANAAVPDAVAARGGDRVVLVYAHSGCRYCADSMPFYRTLAANQRSASIAVAFLTVEDVGTFGRYLGAHGIADPHIERIDRFVGIPGTPALVVLDQNKRVIGSWAGRLSHQQEAHVRRLIGLE